MAGHIATSDSADWCTPPEILEAVREVFSGEIELDPCSNGSSQVGAKRVYTLPEHDGLIEPWDAKTIFVNPPYGRTMLNTKTRECISAKKYKELQERNLSMQRDYPDLADAEPVAAEEWRKQSIADWIRKCSESGSGLNEVIALIPAAVDTKHWQDDVFERAQGVCFLRGRVHFYENGKRGGPAPMACAMVYYGWRPTVFLHIFQSLGKVLSLP